MNAINRGYSVQRVAKNFVKFYEKGSVPLEFVSSRQWFVSILNLKGEGNMSVTTAQIVLSKTAFSYDKIKDTQSLS